MVQSRRQQRASRRQFLGVMCATAVGALIAACSSGGTQTPGAATTTDSSAATTTGAQSTTAASKPTSAPAAAVAPSSSGPAVVTFMSTGGAREQEMFKAALEATNKQLAEQRITVEWQPDPGGGWDKIMSMFAADQAYDVQRIDDDRVAALALANKIWQLDQWMKDAGINTDDFFPLFWTTLNLGGYQFCMNPMCGANAVYYNAELFKQAGVPLPPTSWADAWSWDEFVSYSEKLAKKDARGIPTQYAFGFPTNVISAIAYGAGGTYTNAEQTQCTMTDAKVVDAVDKLVQLTKPGGPELFVPVGVDRREMFNAGKLAMIWDSMDLVQNISQNIAEWDIMPFVKTPDYAMTENYDRTFVVAKTAKFPEAAFKVLYAQCIPPVIDVYAQAAFGVPYHKATAEGPLFLGAEAPPKTKQVWIETMQEINDRPVDVPTPRGPAMTVSKNTFVEDKFEQALSGQMTTQEFLEAGCKESNDTLQQHGWRAGLMEQKLQEAGALTAPGTKMWPNSPNP